MTVLDTFRECKPEKITQSKIKSYNIYHVTWDLVTTCIVACGAFSVF